MWQEIRIVLRKNKDIVKILILGFILRLILLRFGTHTQDITTFQEWSLALIRYPFNKFYSQVNSDYLPGYLYVLWLVGKVYYFINAKLFYVSSDLIYKIPSITSDLINSVLIFLIANKITQRKKAVFAMLLYIFNPAFLFDSVLWGQVDSVVTVFILLSVYFLSERKYVSAFLSVFIGQTFKPVLLLLIPFYLVLLLVRKDLWKVLPKLILPGLVYLLIFLPFSDKNLIMFILERNFSTAGFWKNTTLNSFNLWAVVNTFIYKTYDLISDQNKIVGLTLSNIGIMSFLACYVYLLYDYFRQMKDNNKELPLLFTYLFIVYFAMFHLLTRMHERHSYLL